MGIPLGLREALRPVTVVVGHYGVGKTNLAVNLAIDLTCESHRVSLVDLDVVNPYFRASEQRRLLEDHGVTLIAPVFSEAGTSLDVPSLTGRISPAIGDAGEGAYVIIDAGGDDVGATALGRFARDIMRRDHAMLYVLNRFRNLVQDPADALANLREIELACHLKATALVNNSHLKDDTTLKDIGQGIAYAEDVAHLANLPLACTTVPYGVDGADVQGAYQVHVHVKSPWE